MCTQCAATGAVVATTAATGARVWLAAKAPWFTGAPKAIASGLIVVGAVVAAGLAA